MLLNGWCPPVFRITNMFQVSWFFFGHLPSKMTRYHHSKRLEAVTKRHILEYEVTRSSTTLLWKRQMLSGKFWDFAQRCSWRIQVFWDVITCRWIFPDSSGRCWSRWSLGLWRGFAAACLLELRVRIPPWAWTSLSFGCCQLEVSKTDRSLVQRSTNECACVTECDQVQE